MPSSYIKKILNARIYDLAIETPIDRAHFLSKRLGNQVLIKREDLQPVFSFKLRGAYNKMLQLTEAEKAQGVIAVSAGNHAQGVALSAARMGVKATIVMPRTTPEIKVMYVREHGATVILHGDTFDQAYAHTLELIEKKGYVFIHPYDDPDVIAGQGTVGMEILRRHSDPLHAVFVPVGGGGLIAGIAVYIKYLRPEIKVIGVEAEDSACLTAARQAGKRVTLPQVGIFADGVAVAQIGEEPFRLAQQYVDDVITVTTDQICAAIKDLFDDTRSIAEPAGAVALAGLKKYVAQTGIRNETLLAVESGANINFHRLRHISERTELGERREAILAVSIPERPGSFRTFCRALEMREITEFNYRYADSEQAHVFVGIKLPSGDEEREKLVGSLRSLGYPVDDLTDNEVAKIHIRHMVGGHGKGVSNERVFLFQFPERPGALLNFLNKLGQRWNISMFHYRNHGSAYGRVLVGLQIPASDDRKVNAFLDKLGYHFSEDSDNPAYKLFLS